jgi:starch phosphorylase
LNEGHAAFCALERVRERMASGQDQAAAMQDVSASTVFTTHTPVPAGHDRFDPKLTMKYLKPLADELGLDRRKFLDLGRENPGQAQDPFCMTVLALNLSDHRNGVSALHGEVSREMWQHVEAANKPDDVAIGHVTNGVHTQTWLAPEAYPLYQKFLKPKWDHPEDIGNWFQKADKIEPAEFWALRNTLRAKLVQFIRERLREQIQRRVGDLDNLMMTYDTFDEAALTIGFARRFATYKRAPLIFRDAKRLQAILGDHQRPVQLVFAGKAHPADKAGQSFAQEIFRHTRAAGFRGRVVLLENYDMHIGRMLTSGCDVWLNNPERPREASGTSGMKPPLHGGLNCSILDGWWPEAFNKRNGWAINPESKGRTQRARDRIDAESIYELLENEIVPTFYNRNRHGIPMQWVKMMKNSLKTVGADFSTHRMLTDYLEEYYLPAHTGE